MASSTRGERPAPTLSVMESAGRHRPAAGLMFGYRIWPGILMGTSVVNIMAPGSIVTSLGIACGNTLEALLGTFLVNIGKGVSMCGVCIDITARVQADEQLTALLREKEVLLRRTL